MTRPHIPSAIKRFYGLFWLAAVLCSPSVALHATGDPVISVATDGTKTFSRSELAENLQARRIAVVHPDYGREMNYLAYPLTDIFNLAGVDNWAAPGLTWVFDCLDGYKDPVDADALPGLDLYLAVGEDGTPGRWTPAQAGKIENDPGPFLVVSASGSNAGGFTWPYAVSAIRRVHFEERYPHVYPSGAEPGSKAARGFEVFKTQCFRCHSINLEGGAIGPELNIPKNITEYRSEDFLRAWIKDPNQFRARARMPALGLSDIEIADVIAYLQYMKNLKAKM